MRGGDDAPDLRGCALKIAISRTAKLIGSNLENISDLFIKTLGFVFSNWEYIRNSHQSKTKQTIQKWKFKWDGRN